jgi:HEAT repeat protein
MQQTAHCMPTVRWQGAWTRFGKRVESRRSSASIPGADPVPHGHGGKIGKITEAWLRSGREHGYQLLKGIEDLFPGLRKRLPAMRGHFPIPSGSPKMRKLFPWLPSVPRVCSPRSLSFFSSLVVPGLVCVLAVLGCASRPQGNREDKKVADTITSEMWSVVESSSLSGSYYLTAEQSAEGRALVIKLLSLDLPSLDRKQNLVEGAHKYLLWLYEKGQKNSASVTVAFTEDAIVQIHVKEQIFKTFASDKKLAERIEAFFASVFSNIPFFVANLAHPDREFRINAAKVLANVSVWQSKKVIPALNKALDDNDFEVRLAAAEALIRVKGVNELALTAIFKEFQGADPKCRKKAGETLWKLGDRLPASAVARIKQVLKDNDPELREQAASVLEEMGARAESAVPELTITLADKAWNVRFAAADSLAHIGPKAEPAVAALIRLLNDEDSRVQLRAIAALEAIGPGARPALPALRKWSREHGEYRDKADAAIAAIDLAGTEEKEEL